MEWESAFAGVRKVVDGSPEQMAALEQQLRAMATTMPATAVEIAGVAEAAGQLGVARKDIAAFTATAIKLGVSTNLSAEDAATGLAKLGNVMGVATGEVDRAGAALVALGNAGASTESDILEMAQRIAGAGRLVGMTEAQVLGFANALSSVGIEAEAGGTAISRVFLTIDAAVRDGGRKLDLFASTAGQSAQSFARSWREDAGAATAAFVAGLGRVQKAGGNVSGVLGQLSLDEIRVRDTLLRTSQASDLLAQSVQLGSDAWEANTALVDEANRRFETSESRIQVARNQLNDAAIDIGASVLPAFAALAEDVGTAAQMFRDLPDGVKDTAGKLAAVAAVIGIVGGSAAIALPKVLALKVALEEMGPRGQRAAAGLGRMGTALTGPVGIGVTAGLTVATVALGAWAKSHIEATQRVEAFTEAVKADSGAIGENTRAAAVKALQDAKVLTGARALGLSLDVITEAAIGNSDALAQVTERMDQWVEVMPNGHIVDPFVNLRKELGLTSSEVAKGVQNARDYADAMGETGDAAKDGKRPNKDLAGAIGDVGDEANWADKRLKDLTKTLDDQAGRTLDAREAARQWQEAIDEADKAVSGLTKRQKEHGRALDITTEAGRRNQQTLDDLAEAAIEQATAVGKSTGSDAAFRSSLEQSRRKLIDVAVRMGMTKKAAQEYADSILGVPPVVSTQVRLTGAEAAKRKIDELSSAIRNVPGLQAGIYSGLNGNALPKREHGGPVRAGQPYIVGERQAEVFVPRQDGVILPSVGSITKPGALAGGGPTFNVYAPTTSPADIVATARAEERRARSVGAR
jgi:TP901 family phage tail tape measure protein